MLRKTTLDWSKKSSRYIKGTEDYGSKKLNEQLIGFADADWGANIDDQRSYTGYVFKLANAAVSWESRQQCTVPMSSTEAE